MAGKQYRVGEDLPSVACVRAWHFQVDFFLSAKIQFSSDLECRHTPCLGLLATGRIDANSGRNGMDQLLAVGFKGSFIIR